MRAFFLFKINFIQVYITKVGRRIDGILNFLSHRDVFNTSFIGDWAGIPVPKGVVHMNGHPTMTSSIARHAASQGFTAADLRRLYDQVRDKSSENWKWLLNTAQYLEGKQLPTR